MSRLRPDITGILNPGLGVGRWFWFIRSPKPKSGKVVEEAGDVLGPVASYLLLLVLLSLIAYWLSACLSRQYENRAMPKA